MQYHNLLTAKDHYTYWNKVFFCHYFQNEIFLLSNLKLGSVWNACNGGEGEPLRKHTHKVLNTLNRHIDMQMNVTILNEIIVLNDAAPSSRKIVRLNCFSQCPENKRWPYMYICMYIVRKRSNRERDVRRNSCAFLRGSLMTYLLNNFYCTSRNVFAAFNVMILSFKHYLKFLDSTLNLDT